LFSEQISSADECLQDPNERRGGVGAVAAGDDAELRPVGYQLGYPPRDLTVDFQVIPLSRLPYLQNIFTPNCTATGSLQMS